MPCCNIRYSKFMKVTKGIQILAALLLIVLAIVRFTDIAQLETFSLWIITIYFVLFGLVMLIFEFEIKRVKAYFYFMNFCFGKAIFDFFIGCMVLSGEIHSWLEIPIAVVFFAATLALILIGICYRV